VIPSLVTLAVSLAALAVSWWNVRRARAFCLLANDYADEANQYAEQASAHAEEADQQSIAAARSAEEAAVSAATPPAEVPW